LKRVVTSIAGFFAMYTGCTSNPQPDKGAMYKVLDMFCALCVQ